MTLVVVDASVAAKWFLPGEPLSTEAFSLLARYSKGELRFVVPDLFWAELANILWNSVRLRRIPARFAHSALQSLRALSLPTVPSLDLLDAAIKLALAFDRSVYDSLYVALAVHSKSHLITADEKLANSLAAHLPVKFLRSI